MNKKELVNLIAEKTETTKKDAAAVVDAVIEVVTEALSKGEKVRITGFGTFEVRERAARTGYNPQTGEPIDIPATKYPAFKAGKRLKEIVKQG